MAKAASLKPAGSARIRFVMLEADVPEGELSHFTHAIQQALRPPPSPAATPRIGNSTQRTTDHLNDGEGDAPIIETSLEELDQAEVVEGSRSAKKVPQYRKPRAIEIDLTSEPAFSDFAAEKSPDSNLKRHLVVAAWFKQARRVDAITMDHAFTCYRWVKWPTDMQDWAGPFRTLKRQQKMTQTGDGFAVNQLGLKEVDDLAKA